MFKFLLNILFVQPLQSQGMGWQAYLPLIRCILLNFLRILLRAKTDFFFLLTLGLSYPRRRLVSLRTPDRCTCFLNRFRALSKVSSSLTTTPGIGSNTFLRWLKAESPI